MNGGGNKLKLGQVKEICNVMDWELCQLGWDIW